MHLILGLGQTGFSAVEYCVRAGLPVAVNDTRLTPPFLAAMQQHYPSVPVALGQLDAALIAQATTIVVSPGLPLDDPLLVAHQSKIIGDIGLFLSAIHSPFVAITGTNGKSTVTTMVYDMARTAGIDAEIGGNIGIPVLDLLKKPLAALYVLELSSYQLELLTALSAKVACILNITPDHLDRYHYDIAAYTAAKQRIYQQCEWAVYNAHDAATTPPQSTSRALVFSQDKQAHEEQTWWVENGDIVNQQHLRFPIAALPNTMGYFIDNAVAALTIGTCLNLPPEKMWQGLVQFRELPHRCERVATFQGVTWIDDSKGTNIGATQAALDSVNTPIILIAGGDGKGADFNLLTPTIQKKVRAAILLGKDATQLATAWAHATIIHHVDNLETAVSTAAAMSQVGDTILLSPACASTDMFKDYKARGQCFQQAVQAWMLQQEQRLV